MTFEAWWSWLYKSRKLPLPLPLQIHTEPKWAISFRNCWWETGLVEPGGWKGICRPCSWRSWAIFNLRNSEVQKSVNLSSLGPTHSCLEFPDYPLFFLESYNIWKLRNQFILLTKYGFCFLWGPRKLASVPRDPDEWSRKFSAFPKPRGNATFNL